MSPTNPDAKKAQDVLPLGRRSPKTLHSRAQKAGRRWLHADCGAARTKREVMAALAKGFGFPAHFGGNLDALYDCLTDLEPLAQDPSAGFLLVMEHLPAGPEFGAAQLESLLEVFTDAAEHFRARGIGFQAYYSLSAGSPALP